MNIVPRENTPIDATTARTHLVPAYVEAFGRPPENQELPLLLALVWLETGRGKSMQNNNPGNFAAGDSYHGDAWRPSWFELDENSSERDKQLHQAMLEHKAPSAFRAYESLIDGFTDFVHGLKNTFPEVVAAAKTGDAEAFRAALAEKYSPDYKNPRSSVTLMALQKEFGGTPKAGKAPSPAVPPTAGSPSSGSAQLPTLRLGAEGVAVDLLRALVNRLEPSFAVPATGAFDAALESALKVLQGQLLVVPDGIAGPKFWAALARRLSEPKMTGYG